MMARTAPIVLVHGAWYGAWCWERVVRGLREGGYRVFAPDLPGRPGNPLPVERVSLDSWVSHIRASMVDIGEPVVLVGHSLGGAVLTGVTEEVTSLVRSLVFVAAFLLRNGESASDVFRADPSTAVGALRSVSPDGLWSTVLPGRVEELLCNGCETEDVAIVEGALVPEATAVARTPVHWTNERFGSIQRHFVECSEDRVISWAAQRKMRAYLPCHTTTTLETGHAPFYSDPGSLVAILGEVASQV